MSLLSICQWLQDTQIGTSVRESVWVFPIIESTHVLALSISVGLLLVSDLRLIGYIMKRRAVSEVYDQIKPWMFTGFAIMTITGVFLFWCQAVKAYNSIFFKAKVILLVVAAINAIAFERGIYRTVHQWDNALLPPVEARIAGWTSLILWVAIITCGRTMAYTF
jgi:Family of unknown function (DUF6644)